MKPYYQDSAVTIYNCDCREIVPTLGRFDLLLTDPPYGMDWSFTGQGSGKNAQGGRNSITKGDRIHGDTEDFDPRPWIQYEKVILWGFHHFPQHLSRGSVLVWVKKFEDAWGSFLSDADLAWMNSGCGVYLSATINPASFQREKCHPTQKPVELMKWCIQKAGDVQTILDPFAGSCTTGRAAKDLGRKCVCIEREERYCEIGAKRMAQEVLAL